MEEGAAEAAAQAQTTVVVEAAAEAASAGSLLLPLERQHGLLLLRAPAVVAVATRAAEAAWERTVLLVEHRLEWMVTMREQRRVALLALRRLAVLAVLATTVALLELCSRAAMARTVSSPARLVARMRAVLVVRAAAERVVLV